MKAILPMKKITPDALQVSVGTINRQSQFMMKKIIASLLSVISLMGLVSCVKQAPVFEEPKALVDIENVTMTAHNFVLEDGCTKTSITLGDEGLNFSWSSNDIVGVFPNNGKGTQVKFPISDGEVEGGSSTSNANFTGNGWAVMKAENYSSYYPFVPDMDLDMKAIPVSYTGQVQVGSGTTGHLSGYDYMLTTPTEPSSNGNIGFDFNHLGVILQFEMVVPKVAEYTSLSLTCEGKPFITCGTIDITSGGSPSITATEWCDEFEIALEDFATTEPNQTVVINLIMAPDDFSGKQIKVKLKGPHAAFVTHFTRAEGKPYKPGTASRPTLGDLQGGEVVILSDGDTFNRAIKSLANGEDYITEKTDYLIRHIIFKANDGSVPTNPYVDVSDPESPSPIYASWDASTGTMTISSNAYKIYANNNANGMFRKLSKLVDVEMDDFALDYAGSINQMFENCENLLSVDFSGQNMSSLDLFCLRYVFDGCSRLESVTWPTTVCKREGNSELGVDIEALFRNCVSLESVDMSAFAGCKMHRISNAFYGCTNLKSIDLSMMDFSITSLYDSAFWGCSSLTSIDVSNFGWGNIDQYSSYVFANCTNLRTINLGDFYTSDGVDLNGFFQGCKSLEEIRYTRFAPRAATYGSFFDGCESLRSIDVSQMVTSKTTNISSMFWGCSSLQSLDVSDWNTSSVTSMANLFTACKSLESLDLSNFKTFETINMHGMFFQCENLRTITFGENFNTEKVNDMGGMFNGCTSLSSIDLSGFNTSRVLSFAEMFKSCTDLSSITWGEHFDTHYAEDFSWMFAESGFETLDLSFFDTRSANNYESMFEGCPKLKTLDISSFTTDHTESVYSMFMDSPKLNSIKMGSRFNPTDFRQAFGSTGKDHDSRITIWCTPAFMNSFAAHEYSHWVFTPENVTWINCITEEPMTWPTV